MSVFAPRLRCTERRRTGLSIVEVLISLAIVAMLLTAVASAFSASSQIIEQNDQFFRATQAARVSINQIITEARRARAVTVPSSDRINMITFDDQDRSYVYDSDAKIIKLVTNGNTTDPDYTVASNVTSCSLAEETKIDKGGISHVVRVSVELTVKVGPNEVRLTGSAAPRREMSY